MALGHENVTTRVQTRVQLLCQLGQLLCHTLQ